MPRNRPAQTLAAIVMFAEGAILFAIDVFPTFSITSSQHQELLDVAITTVWIVGLYVVVPLHVLRGRQWALGGILAVTFDGTLELFRQAFVHRNALLLGGDVHGVALFLLEIADSVAFTAALSAQWVTP